MEFFLSLAEKRRKIDLSGISMIKMRVRPTFGIMPIGHNISDALSLVFLMFAHMRI